MCMGNDMKKVLVTGAGGYIGSTLVPKLLKNGYAVRAIDRFFFGREMLEDNSRLEKIQEDSRKLTDGHFDGIDCVIDLVAVSNDPAGEMFADATWQINHKSRVSSAEMAKKNGAKRYVLPSSCSIYGFTDDIVDETSPTNPLTVYAKANQKAENGVLPLADDDFSVTVIRQATVFGYSPRMRFDLAINGMTFGAWKDRVLPLMRDGSQFRPMVHVQDTTDVMIKLLEADPSKVSGQIFNVGSAACNFQIGPLGDTVAEAVGRQVKSKVKVEWYGDPDHRSYRVDFGKIEKALDWRAQWDGERGVAEIVEALDNGKIDKTTKTLTLDWYRNLVEWHRTIQEGKKYIGKFDINRIIKEVEKYGGILDIDS